MAINACSVNGFTIDAGRCRNKFAALIPILHPTTSAPKVSNGGWAKARPPANYRGINAPRWERDEVPREVPTELERITVTASFDGRTGTDTQQITSRPDLVTVTDIRIEAGEVSVNIANLQIT